MKKTFEELEAEKARLIEENKRKALAEEIWELKHGKKIKKLKNVGSSIGSFIQGKLKEPVLIKCNKCGRTLRTDNRDWKKQTCKVCGGYFNLG